MDNFDAEERSSDFDIEITDLDSSEDGTQNNPSFPRRRAMPQVSARTLNRSLRVAVVISLLLLIILVISTNFPFVWNWSRGALNSFRPSQYSASTSPIIDHFYIDVGVPWTHISIDGHEAHPTRIGVDQPVQLSYGSHYIEWSANPFQNQSCVVSVPISVKDTCQVSFANQARVLLLYESLTTLPTNQQDSLIDAVEETIENHPASEIVQPGEVYITNQGGALAEEPLVATLHFFVDIGLTSGLDLPCQFDLRTMASEPCRITGQDCHQLCIIPWQNRQTQQATVPQGWFVFALTYLSRNYATRDGDLLAQRQPLEWSGTASSNEHPVLLQITWQNKQWQVQWLLGTALTSRIHQNSLPVADNPACIVAQDMLVPQLSSSPYKGFAGYSQVRFISDSNPAKGCLAIATTNSVPDTPQATPQTAIYLERFGKLLAANDAARSLNPALPATNTYEQKLVQQMQSLRGVDVRAS